MRRYTLNILLVLNLLLSIGLAWMWFDETGARRSVAWVPPSLRKGELPKWPASLKPTTEDTTVFLNTLEKPLFSLNRRPPPPPPPVTPPPPPPPPDPLQTINIVGVFGTGLGSGIFATIDGGMRRIAKGDLIGEWTLKAVGDREATFSRRDERKVIRLTYDTLVTGPALPPSPPPPSPANAPTAGAAPAAAPRPVPRAVFGGGLLTP